MEHPPNSSTSFPIAALELAEVEGECEALRGTVESQRHAIERLEEELEEERNAASTAANEAMSMILRLQREKAQALLESRQFHRLAEERFHHDQQEIESLEEELSRREDLVQALSRQIQDPPAAKSDPSEEEEFAGAETAEEVLEKEIVLGESPGGGNAEREEEEETGGVFSDGSACESGVRDYTIDAVHGMGGSSVGGSGREREPGVVGESDVRDLQKRVEGLEEDSEVMRREIVDMKMEDKHLMMLREISRNLLQVMMVQHMLVQVRVPEKAERRVLKNRSYFSWGFSLLALLKWLVSFLIFWRRHKPSQPELPSRGSCGSSRSKIGLFLLLEKSPLFQRLRCLPKARGRAIS